MLLSLQQPPSVCCSQTRLPTEQSAIPERRLNYNSSLLKEGPSNLTLPRCFQNAFPNCRGPLQGLHTGVPYSGPIQCPLTVVPNSGPLLQSTVYLIYPNVINSDLSQAWCYTQMILFSGAVFGSKEDFKMELDSNGNFRQTTF